MNWHVAHIGHQAAQNAGEGFAEVPVGALTAMAYRADTSADRKDLALSHYRQAAQQGGRGLPLPFGLFSGTLDDTVSALRGHADALGMIHERLAGSAEVTLSVTSDEPAEKAANYLRARKLIQQLRADREDLLQRLTAELAACGFMFRETLSRADQRCERTSHLDLTCATADASRLLNALEDLDCGSGRTLRIAGPFVPFGTVARAWSTHISENLPC